jgi:hypothetical protein
MHGQQNIKKMHEIDFLKAVSLACARLDKTKICPVYRQWLRAQGL